MAGTKNRKQSTKVDGDQYINKDTGELLSSEVPGIRSVISTDPDLVMMHSDEYVVLDSEAVRYIEKNFSPTDLGRILRMADMTYGEFNILYNGNVPHDKQSLMEELEYSRNKFANFMKRLHMKSVIYYLEGYTNGRKYRHIMLNPYLARKRKTMNKECGGVFQNIKELGK